MLVTGLLDEGVPCVEVSPPTDIVEVEPPRTVSRDHMPVLALPPIEASSSSAARASNGTHIFLFFSFSFSLFFDLLSFIDSSLLLLFSFFFFFFFGVCVPVAPVSSSASCSHPQLSTLSGTLPFRDNQPPLLIEWPTSEPLAPREPDALSELLLEQLRALLTQRPLISLEALEKELIITTSAYHVLGYPRDIWMATLASVWSGAQALHHAERLLEWERETLPRLSAIQESLGSAEGEAAAIALELEAEIRRRDHLGGELREHISVYREWQRRLSQMKRTITQCFRDQASTRDRSEQLQAQAQEVRERITALRAQADELERTRPGAS